MQRWWSIFSGAVLVSVIVACGGGTPAASQVVNPSEVAVATVVPTVRPTATPAPALVGTWLGVHNCQRIMDLMTAAGMPKRGLMNVVDAGTLPGVTSVSQIHDPAHPCVGAVDVAHSHFFTAGGLFGSRDANGQQVDDGKWTIVDADTFAIGGVPFDYRIEGDALSMQAVDVGTCPDNGQWCQEAWKLMVAMPGMAWTRN